MDKIINWLFYLTLISAFVITMYFHYAFLTNSNIFINRDAENQIVLNTYERYDEIYASLFYNEYKQLFYIDYFIGE